VHWGIVRFGGRFVLLQRLGGGRYRARPALRRAGGLALMVEGGIDVVLLSAFSYASEHAATAAAREARVSADRWTHLDRAQAA
jgi:hypothetical protein